MKRLFIIIVAVIAILLMLSACGGNNPSGSDKDSYTITYTNNAGELAATTVDTQTGITLEKQDMTGYKFIGYFTPDGVQYFDENGNQLPSILVDKDIRLIPQFEPHKYTIVLDAQTGTFNDGTARAEIGAVYSEDISEKLLIPKATTEKFEFDGWYSEDGSVRYSHDQIMHELSLLGDNATITLYAKFKVKELTITVDFCDGITLPEEFKVSYGEGFGDLSKYTKDNGTQYIRTWSITSYSEVNLPSVVTEDMRIYAVWQNYKSVNFVYSSAITKEERVDITAGQSSILPENAILPGYKFMGWYSSAVLSGNPITTVPYGALQDTYYAKWQETDYSLDFVTGTNDTLEQIRYRYGDTTALPELTRTGYTFEGWSTGEEGANPFKSIPSTLFGDLALVAVWTPYKINVTLDADGGRLNDYSIELDYESYYTLEIPTRSGYEFVGWYLDDIAMTDGEGVASNPWISLEEATFVAKWTVKIYTVQYITGTDEAIEAKQYEHGEKIELPADLKNGELFLEGWYYDEALESRVSLNATVKSNLTLYANWREMLPISSVDDLKSLADSSDFIYYLENDINLNGENWTPIPDFTGILYGKGHKIYNFSLSNTSSPSQYGVFAKNSGIIRDVVIDDFTCNIAISGISSSVGILVGYNEGTISGCSVISGTAKISSSTPRGNQGGVSLSLCFGNIAGQSTGDIDNCTTSNVEAILTPTADMPYIHNIISHNYHNAIYAYAGGIVGYTSGNISYCSSDAKITSNANSYGWDDAKSSALSVIGGIVGELRPEGTLTRCYASPSLTVTSNATSNSAFTYAYSGAVAGTSYGNVSESISQGTVTAGSNSGTYTGGLIGINNGELSDSYSEATANGGSSGGLVGLNENTIRSCLSACEMTMGAGLCGTNKSTGTITKCISVSTITSEDQTVSYIAVGSNSGTLSKIYSLEENERQKLLSYDFLVGELYWDEAVWTVDKGGMFTPTLNWENE